MKKVCNRGMEEAPENGKESSHSARANGMNEWFYLYNTLLRVNLSDLVNDTLNCICLNL